MLVARIEDALTQPNQELNHEYLKELANNYQCDISTIYRHKKRIEEGLRIAERTGGRYNTITWEMEIAIKQLLDKRPWFYQDEIRDFLYAAYGVEVHQSTISRALSRLKITRKKLRVEAAQRNQVLRDEWLFNIQEYTAEQIICVDESGSDERTGDRQYGYSHRGARARVQRFLKDRDRVSVLPAYTIDGYIVAKTFYGTGTTEIFEDFIFDQLLPLTTPFPGPRSVIVLDNASIYHGNREGIEIACHERGIKILWLPPYSPDFNPIEESFSDLKAWIRRNYRKHIGEFATYQDFLDYAVREVGTGAGAARRARAHFRHCGIQGIPQD